MNALKDLLSFDGWLLLVGAIGWVVFFSRSAMSEMMRVGMNALKDLLSFEGWVFFAGAIGWVVFVGIVLIEAG